MDPVALLLLAAWASLAVELAWLAVPSEASVRGLWRGARARPARVKVLLLALPTVLGALCFLIPPVAVLWPTLAASLWPLPGLDAPALRWAGAGLAVLGRALTLAATLQLRRRRGAGIDVETLQSSGLYARSRNPGLVGMAALYLGGCLVVPCLVLLVGFVVYAVNMHHRVRLEESYLLQRLGEPYQAYLARVPRYL